MVRMLARLLSTVVVRAIFMAIAPSCGEAMSKLLSSTIFRIIGRLSSTT